jgi:hypothetical protein
MDTRRKLFNIIRNVLDTEYDNKAAWEYRNDLKHQWADCRINTRDVAIMRYVRGTSKLTGGDGAKRNPRPVQRPVMH